MSDQVWRVGVSAGVRSLRLLACADRIDSNGKITISMNMGIVLLSHKFCCESMSFQNVQVQGASLRH